MAESWKPVPGTNCEASNQGRIRGPKGIRKLCAQTHGYLFFSVWKKGNFSVARSVLTAFVGSPGEGQECRHLNGNNTDNRLCNLAWADRQTNVDDQVTHGTRRRGDDNANSILTSTDVRKIRAAVAESRGDGSRCAPGLLISLSAKYGVSRAAIKAVVARKTWAYE